MSDDEVMKKELMEEAHHSLYVVHLGSTKMYRDLREFFSRSNMKRKVAK